MQEVWENLGNSYQVLKDSAMPSVGRFLKKRTMEISLVFSIKAMLQRTLILFCDMRVLLSILKSMYSFRRVIFFLL